MSGDTERADSLRLHLDRPSSARIYDYMLGGKGPNNYAIDREFGDRQLATMPDLRRAMRENRRFVGRVVETALERGIDQFIDLGAGLPTQSQPHEIADRLAPDLKARVVYVDNELIAHAHSEILLASTADPERHQAVLGDFFNHGALWRSIRATGLIDPERPTCLLVTALLHFMFPEDRPDVPMSVYRDKIAPGSLLVLTHVPDVPEDDALQEVTREYGTTASPSYLRTDEEFLEFFGGWPLLEPGLEWTGLWRPHADRSQEPWWDEDTRGLPEGEPWWEDQPSRMYYRAGVAVKP
ncbi:hypothetical protein FHX82_006404 [Amycolatopsis bartoniae]|uniref:Polyketide biosynthesis methyltransferase n=1 Tax=Amycolatopsis bartoniae TaxID=941986 RepID=A0A8H9IQ75_9PSEU|nr:SAM-dependent methyltransferase [Amycolatopsis bartoniae]MBB2939318.1 hypothetical protein [Amycolatopsis bartoniae]TVT08768.1 polyketide biosynthesis methyltransferase [Amycolatopsis bartoniae]GHF37353.1 hypothetical protein GCM10017566_08130 [Amycolatopsis bartoniae]